MYVAVLAHLILGFAVAQEPARVKTTTFADPLLNLQFDHDSKWKLVPPVKKKGLKPLTDRTTFTYPIEGGTLPVILEVVRAQFNAKPELWQELQVQAAQQLHREVTRQWQQEVLGIPTLFTRTTYKEGDDRMASLSGLFYMRGPRKMLLRLVCEESVLDKAQGQLILTMESLRTIDGSTPQPEDPERKADPNEAKSRVVPISNSSTTSGVTAMAKLTNSCAVSIANRSYSIKTLSNWAAATKDAMVTFTEIKTGQKFTGEVRSTLDSEAPDASLAKLATERLAKFDKVSLREDFSEKSPFGCAISSVLRHGSDAKGVLIIGDTVVVSGDIYLRFNLTSRDAIAATKETESLRSLVLGLTIVQSK